MRHLTNTIQRGQQQIDRKGYAPTSKPHDYTTSKETIGIFQTSKSTSTNTKNNENKTNGSDERLDSISPSKRQKPKMTREVICCGETPIKGRTFGEEIDANNIDNFSILDTSQISIDTKDTAISGLTLPDDHHSSDTLSDCATEITNASSHVAKNRELFDEFGKTDKQHCENSRIPRTAESLERAVRSKVASTFPTSASASSKPNVLHSTATSIHPVPNHTSSSTLQHVLPIRYYSSTHPITQKSRMGVNPPPPPTQQAVKHGTTNTSGSSAVKTRGATVRATPIRIKPKIKSEEVQATNEGYASVAKLSAWLADDPTSTKKLKQLRRGANVIAKSRKFDKELVNVVIEQTGLPRGCVSRQRDVIEQCCMAEAYNEDDDELGEGRMLGLRESTTVTKTNAKDWMRLGAPGSDVGISVSDKKKWLSSAFKKSSDDDCASVSATKKAFTEIITTKDRNEDVSSRAKQLWRRKHSPMRDQVKSNQLASPCIIPPVKVYPAQQQEDEVQRSKKEREQLEAILQTTSSETTATTWVSCLSKDDSTMTASTATSTGSTSKYPAAEKTAAPSTGHQSCIKSPMRSDKVYSSGHDQLHYPSKIDNDSDAEGKNHALDFRVAREILIQRSKANGNPVDASKVQLRKAKFEMLERESRRRLSNQSSSAASLLLKSSWEDASKTGGGCYVKRNYALDIAPKKSFEDLP